MIPFTYMYIPTFISIKHKKYSIFFPKIYMILEPGLGFLEVRLDQTT